MAVRFSILLIIILFGDKFYGANKILNKVKTIHSSKNGNVVTHEIIHSFNIYNVK